jgi:hypothetical protein
MVFGSGLLNAFLNPSKGFVPDVLEQPVKSSAVVIASTMGFALLEE